MTVEENREIARRFVEEVWGHGDEDVAREIVDRNVVHHRQRAQETFGIAGLYEGLRLYETAYPQRTFEQTDVVVEGKFVQDRWVMSAVHSGDMLGVPPTGRQVTLNGQNRYLIENGRIVEIWHDEDIYGMMRQIGWEPSLPDGGSQDAWPPRRATRYGLPGPQVEPEAGVWAVPPCPLPSVIRVEDVLARTDDPDDPWYFPPYPDDAGTQAELAELAELVAQRDDPTALAGGVGPLRRQGPSPFLLLRPAPVTAVYDLSRTDPTRMVNTGRDLARWFENETPGLSHRQAATFLLNAAGWSPPRHTLVWAALDVAIHSAVLACWHYKWASERTRVAWRPRPVEVDYHVDVLYNRAVDLSGLEGQARSTPRPSPGTPRHPSYPSGHASVGGAGSEILSYFFPDYTAELDQLADNCGMARLWAGIHYRSDHVEGVKLGRHVARMVIAQLQDGAAPRTPRVIPPRPPTTAEVRQWARELSRRCAQGSSGT